MKKRLEKKAEKLRRKKIHEALEIVLEINGSIPREGIMNGKEIPVAFFDFLGVTGHVSAQIYPNGWINKKFGDYDYFSAYVKESSDLDELLLRLKAEKEALKNGRN